MLAAMFVSSHCAVFAAAVEGYAVGDVWGRWRA